MAGLKYDWNINIKKIQHQAQQEEDSVFMENSQLIFSIKYSNFLFINLGMFMPVDFIIFY